MRYDKEIYFKSITTKYNYETGNHDLVQEKKDKRYANITNQNQAQMVLIYGSIKANTLTIRLQNHYTKPFDCVEIDGEDYQVDAQRILQHNHVLQVSKL